MARTIGNKGNRRPGNRVTRGDRAVAWSICGIWCFLGIFFLVSTLQPGWLQRIADPGKESEARAYKHMGDQFLRDGDLGKAARSYQRALEIQPEMSQAAGNLGIVYSRLNRLNDAIVLFRRQLELDPERAYTAYYNLAEIFARRGEREEAARYYALSAEGDPDPLHAFRKAGSLYLSLKEYSTAANYFRRAISARREISRLYKAMLRKRLRDLEETAAGEATGRIRDGGADAGAGDSYADDAEALRRRLKRGISDKDLEPYDTWVFDACLARDREFAKTHYFLALCYTANRKDDIARRYIETALKVWPGFTEARQRLHELDQLDAEPPHPSQR